MKKEDFAAYNRRRQDILQKNHIENLKAQGLYKRPIEAEESTIEVLLDLLGDESLLYDIVDVDL